MPYSWLTFEEAQDQLYERLSQSLFWDATNEIGLYIIEALRTWNAMTGYSTADMVFSTAAQTWYDLSAVAGTVRPRTVDNTAIATLVEYALLEPPSGLNWTGTTQFTINDILDAMNARRNEMIQKSFCRIAQLTPIPAPANNQRFFLPDNVLEVIRVRFIPADSEASPITLWRDDELAQNMFEPQHVQQANSNPLNYGVIASPQLAVQVDVAPAAPGTWDVIALVSGAQLNAGQVPALVGIPDDFTPFLVWGCLQDLLSSESEATDEIRARFAMQRYMDGLKLLGASPWLLLGRINNYPVDTESVAETDQYNVNWDSLSTAYPKLVTAGVDFLAACPVGPSGVQSSITLSVVQNMPVPVEPEDFIQVGQDIWPSVLDYAQFLAGFKMGGAESVENINLVKNFALACRAYNRRLEYLGVFDDVMKLEGHRQEIQTDRPITVTKE